MNRIHQFFTNTWFTWRFWACIEAEKAGCIRQSSPPPYKRKTFNEHVGLPYRSNRSRSLPIANGFHLRAGDGHTLEAARHHLSSALVRLGVICSTGPQPFRLRCVDTSRGEIVAFEARVWSQARNRFTVDLHRLGGCSQRIDTIRIQLTDALNLV